MNVTIRIPSCVEAQSSCSLCNRPPVRVISTDTLQDHLRLVSRWCVEHFDELMRQANLQAITYEERLAHKEER